MKIVTFNLRSNLVKDGINCFHHRAGLIYKKIREEQPEIIAFQEVVAEEREILEKLLPEYLFVGSDRDKSANAEGLFTVIRKDAVALCGMDVFWLGPDPYDPATRFEGQSKHARICVETLLKLKASGRLLRVYNVHTDHMNQAAAVKGLECVLAKVTENKRKLPADTVILGDSNAKPEEGVTQTMAAYQDVPLYEATENITYSFHNFGRCVPPIKIDYIYVSESLENAVKAVSLWEDEENGIWLSDHYPVAMEVEV